MYSYGAEGGSTWHAPNNYLLLLFQPEPDTQALGCSATGTHSVTQGRALTHLLTNTHSR